MRILLIGMAILFYVQIAFGQSYRVLEAKKVFRIDGEKVKKNQMLYGSDTIDIREKGYLLLDVESAMDLKLAPGRYHVRTESRRLNEWYDQHLFWTKYLKKNNLIMCKFSYKTLVVPGSDRHYEIDRIEMDQKSLVSIPSDTTALSLNWTNPDYRFKGTYYLIVRDFYNNGFIDILETNENTLTFYPGKYGHKHMIYNIMASDCRASFRYKIEVNSPGAVTNVRTNFTPE